MVNDGYLKSIFDPQIRAKLFFAIVGIIVLLGIGFDLFLLRGKGGSGHKTNEPYLYNADPFILRSSYKIVGTATKELINFAKPGFDDSNWNQIKFGSAELRTLSGYSNQKGVILHRIVLKIPRQLYHLNQPLVFYIPFVNYFRYQTFINGYQVSDEPGQVYPFNIGLVAIPRSSINSSFEVILGIRGEFEAGDLGLSYYTNPLIGVKGEFKDIYVEDERLDNSFYNVLLALKAGFLLFFIIIFLVTKPQRFMSYFLLYASCSTIATAFIILKMEDYLSINVRAFLMFGFQGVGIYALWFFIENLLETRVLIQRLIIGLHAISLGIMLIFFVLGKFGIDLRILFKFYYLGLTEVLVAVLMVVFKRMRLNPYRLVANIRLWLIALLFGLYFLIHLWLHYFASKFNHSSQQPVDILFFLFVGFLASSEFLRNQLKVIELSDAIELQSTEVELGKSAARIAHDIRKPFTNLKIALETIKLGNANPNVVEKLLDEVTNTITYGEELAQQILEVKRSGIQRLNPCQPKKIVSRFLELEGKHLSQNGIRYKIDYLTDRLILGDETSIISILQNIINNAIESLEGKESKKIEITFKDYHDSIGNCKCRMTIRNNGPIIPSPILKKLFNTQVTYGKSKGTGIGLSSVKNQIDKMNAEIDVYNLPQGEGVAFEISFLSIEGDNGGKDFSLFEEQISRGYGDKTKPLPLQMIERLVVVDDDELIQIAWKMVWSNEEIYVFSSPEELLSYCKSNTTFLASIDLVITDQYFGEKSTTTGTEFCRILRQMGFVNIVISSGSAEINRLESVEVLKTIDKQILTKPQLNSLLRSL